MPTKSISAKTAVLGRPIGRPSIASACSTDRP